MSCPDTPAFRMRNAAAASPPNPPPTTCAFICPLSFGDPPTPGSTKQRGVRLARCGCKLVVRDLSEDMSPQGDQSDEGGAFRGRALFSSLPTGDCASRFRIAIAPLVVE